MASFSRVLVSFFVLLVALNVERSVAETNHTVGDATGWGIPTNPEFYDDWENNKVFRVGDNLIFNWNGVHDVAQVTEAQYDACTKVTNVSSTSPTIVKLTTVGDHYFICTIGSHCSAGQKLSIEVVAAAPGAPPTTSGSAPSPAGSTGSGSGPTGSGSGTTGSPPAGSSSPAFGPAVALSAALSGLALLL